MTHSLQKKYSQLSNIFSTLFVPVTLAIFSLIPIYKTFGKLVIGHDTLVPLMPEFSFKMAHEWIDTANGIYMSNNLYAWILPFYILSKIGLSIYHAAFIYQFLIYFLSGVGIYKIYNLFNRGNRLFGLLPALFIIISPHYLDHQVYYQGTVGIFWLAYFILKFIKNKKFFLLDIVFLAISLGIIADLPNPKYHFLAFILLLAALITALILKLISVKDILASKANFFLLFLASLYLSLPYLYYGFYFLQNSEVKILVKQGYKETGVALDYGYALIGKMIRLFHSPNLNAKDGEVIESPLFFLAYYAIPVIVLGVFPFILRSLSKYSKKIYLVFYFLIFLFLFLSKSSNPPSGFFYEYLLSNFKAFAFMRTTAGIIIFVAIFYSLIYGKVFQFIAEKKEFKNQLKLPLLVSLLILIFITGYPFWSGHFFLNRSTVNPYVNRNEYGMKIPQEYFQSASFLSRFKLDSKIDVYPHALNYQNNDWGYFGFLIYPWLIDKPMIGFKKTATDGKAKSNTNALFIYHDKTLEQNYAPEDFWHPPEKLIFTSQNIDIYRKSYSDYLPHFYISKNIYFPSFPSDETLKKITSDKLTIVEDKKLLYLSQQLSDISVENPIIEYKKINPAKYRLKIHGASKPFLLIFTENFDPNWKIYPNSINQQENVINLLAKAGKYQVFLNNEDEQANAENLKNFVMNGWMSSIGENFVSKNIKNTIQNDNLGNGRFFETFFLKSLDEPHFMANQYANAWLIEPKKISNQKGLKDFELIVEFHPQRLAYLSYTISGLTIFILSFFSLANFSFSLYHRIVSRKPSLNE